VPEGLAERVSLGLGFLGDSMVFVPGEVELVPVLRMGHAAFFERADPVGDGVVAEAMGDTQPSTSHLSGAKHIFLGATIPLAELLRLRSEIHQIVPV